MILSALILLTSCATETPSSTPPPTITPTVQPTTTPEPTRPPTPRPSLDSPVVVVPYLQFDGFRYVLRDTWIVQLRWPDAPNNANSVEFQLKQPDALGPYLILTDTRMSDGAAMRWLVSEAIYRPTEIRAVANMPDGTFLAGDAILVIPFNPNLPTR